MILRQDKPPASHKPNASPFFLAQQPDSRGPLEDGLVPVGIKADQRPFLQPIGGHMLFVHQATGTYRPATPLEILSSARTVARSLRPQHGPFRNPELVGAYLRHRFAALPYEVFVVCHLDAGHYLIAEEELFRGTVHTTAVYPREVLRQVMRHNAHAVILAHNHPSGNCTPSEQDRSLTHRLTELLAQIDVAVLDHLVIGREIFSLTQNQIIQETAYGP